MALWLPLLFIGLPIAEIAVFIMVGGAIGVLPTIALVLLAAVAGMSVIRRQGIQTLARLQASLDAGGIAGILLFGPGFLTDGLGLLLLIPAVRSALIRRGAARTTVRFSTFGRAGRPRQPSPETIEADYEIVENGTPPRRGSSGWTRPDD